MFDFISYKTNREVLKPGDILKGLEIEKMG